MRGRHFILLSLLSALVAAGRAVQLGDTLEQVIAEKGKPPGEMNAGTAKILNFSDQTIKLKAGKVVEITPALRAPERAPAAAAVAPAGFEPINPGEWTVSCKQALWQAKVQKRRVFMLFTGSDWSAYSQRFHEEVLKTPEFGRYAVEKLVLVLLDFPKKLEQSPGLKGQNEAMLRTFKIERFPTVVILDSDAKPLGVLPYEEGGAVKFIAAMNKL